MRDCGPKCGCKMPKNSSIKFDELKTAKNKISFSELILFAQDVSLNPLAILWTPCNKYISLLIQSQVKTK